MSDSRLKCLTWNTEWAPRAKPRGQIILQQIDQVDPDVVCYTEVLKPLIPEGHTIEADADYGCKHNGTRRKAALWSKTPWEQVDQVGDPDMPTGRFISGVTQGIRFLGVCIPWKDAHATSGRKDRKPWEDHVSFCHGLAITIERYSAQPEPLCILGDFNQRIPRSYQPKEVAEALLAAFPSSFNIATVGAVDLDGNPLIDHIAGSSGIRIDDIQVLPRIAEDGTRLSDHVGVACSIGPALD